MKSCSLSFLHFILLLLHFTGITLAAGFMLVVFLHFLLIAQMTQNMTAVVPNQTKVEAAVKPAVSSGARTSSTLSSLNSKKV